MELIASDRADATLNAETAFGDYISKHPDEPVKIVAYSDDTASSLVPVRKGEDALREAIDEALADDPNAQERINERLKQAADLLGPAEEE